MSPKEIHCLITNRLKMEKYFQNISRRMEISKLWNQCIDMMTEQMPSLKKYNRDTIIKKFRNLRYAYIKAKETKFTNWYYYKEFEEVYEQEDMGVINNNTTTLQNEEKIDNDSIYEINTAVPVKKRKFEHDIKDDNNNNNNNNHSEIQIILEEQAKFNKVMYDQMMLQFLLNKHMYQHLIQLSEEKRKMEEETTRLLKQFNSSMNNYIKIFGSNQNLKK